MKNEIAQVTKGLAIAIAFASKYPELEDVNHSTIIVEQPNITIWCNTDNRESTLAGVGKLLGRDGWLTQESYGAKSLNWKKELDGVVVILDDAQELEKPPVGIPVPPSAFPLMLEDTEDPIAVAAVDAAANEIPY